MEMFILHKTVYRIMKPIKVMNIIEYVKQVV